jgi:chromosome segregation ATPase
MFLPTYTLIKNTHRLFTKKQTTMKKIVYLFSALMLTGGISLTSCNNTADTTDNDEKKDTVVIEDKDNTVNERVATAEEWAAFKTEAEQKIEANEKRIAELKAKKKKSGKVLDKVYEERIEALQERNRNLRTKITNYESNNSDWDKFKEEFNRDMDELGKAIGDLFKDNE